MKMKTTAGIALLAALSIGATELRAQGPIMGGRGARALGGGAAVERIMSMRDRLELTDDQIATLDALRVEAVERRNAEASEFNRLRSQLAAGQIRRSELMALREDQAEARREFLTQHRERLEAALSEDQRATLQRLRRQAGAVRPGRGGDRAAPGPGADARARGPAAGPGRRPVRAPRGWSPSDGGFDRSGSFDLPPGPRGRPGGMPNGPWQRRPGGA
jgi:hypothetical protein